MPLKPTSCILIVDDFPTMRKILKGILKQFSFTNIIEAEDGQKALEVLRSNSSVEFIVSDWNMPVMTGFELLKAVRADPKLKHLPFLMVTAEGEKENIVEAVRAGVSNYVIKPYNSTIIKEKIDLIFAKR